MLLVALAEAGKWAKVDDEIHSYAAVSEPTRQPGLNWYLPLWRGMRAAMRGDRPAQDEQAAELERLVASSGSNNALLLEGTQQLVRAIDADRPADAVPLLGRFINGAPGLTSATHPTFALLLALTGSTDEAARRLTAYVQGLPDRVQDSEWLPDVVQAAMISIVLLDRDAAATLYRYLAPYGDVFACLLYTSDAA